MTEIPSFLKMNNIPLCGYTTFVYAVICHGHLVCFHLLAIVVNAARNMSILVNLEFLMRQNGFNLCSMFLFVISGDFSQTSQNSLPFLNWAKLCKHRPGHSVPSMGIRVAHSTACSQSPDSHRKYSSACRCGK